MCVCVCVCVCASVCVDICEHVYIGLVRLAQAGLGFSKEDVVRKAKMGMAARLLYAQLATSCRDSL